MDINDLLQGPLKDIIINQVGSQLGLGDQNQANSAVDGVFGTLLNAISKNASTPEGAGGLMAALDRDHDGSILNDLGGFLSGAVTPSNPNTANGAGILKHILGDNQTEAAENIAKESGIDTGKVLKMMVTLAPVVLGMLGKFKSQAQPEVQQTQQAQQGGGGLLDFIQGATKTVNQQPTNQSIFSKLLDKDGDGSMIDDIAEMGVKSIFGKMFGGK